MKKLSLVTVFLFLCFITKAQGDRILQTYRNVEVSWRLVSDFQPQGATCWGWTYHIFIFNRNPYPITVKENTAYQNQTDYSPCWESGEVSLTGQVVPAQGVNEYTFRVTTSTNGGPGSPGLEKGFDWTREEQVIDYGADMPNSSNPNERHPNGQPQSTGHAQVDMQALMGQQQQAEQQQAQQRQAEQRAAEQRQAEQQQEAARQREEQQRENQQRIDEQAESQRRQEEAERERQLEQQREFDEKRQAITDNYNNQVEAVNQWGQNMNSMFDDLLKQNQDRYDREEAERRADMEVRDQEREQARMEQQRQREEEERERDRQREEEQRQREEEERQEEEAQRQRDEEQRKWMEQMQAEAARKRANIDGWRNRSMNILPNELKNAMVKKPIEIDDPDLKSVYYVIWNFQSDNQIIISKPIEINKSPDGDWPLTGDVYEKITTDTKLVMDQTPDKVPTGENELHYLLGYFTNQSAAFAAVNNIKGNAARSGYSVNYINNSSQPVNEDNGYVVKDTYRDTPPASAQQFNSTSGVKYHIVEKGQTLYRLSVIYGASVQEIKEWNGLTSNDISVGQKVIVSHSEPTNQNNAHGQNNQNNFWKE